MLKPHKIYGIRLSDMEQQMLALRNAILEMIAKGADLKPTLDKLCRMVEELAPDLICTVLQVDREGYLRPLSAPSLPEAYCDAIDGLMIGPQVGSCGSAAYLRRPVIVSDISDDVRWRDYMNLALAFGLRACWSTPIFDRDGQVFATFALYFRETRSPRPEEHEIVDACTQLCCIALEHDRRVRERERLALVDALTELGNRAAFAAALGQLSCDSPGSWALLVLDLDNLKVTNDAYGHPVGDQLIRAVANRARTSASPDHVFRTGGDEFAILVQSPEALCDLGALAERILTCLEAPIVSEGHTLIPRATIGGAIVTAGDISTEAVLRHADIALYHAKEIHRGGFVRYWPGIDTRLLHRVAAVRDVSAALAEGRIEAHYQPIVHFDTREIIGLEALCRLRMPMGQFLSASNFQEATEDPKIASGVTRRMLELVARDMRDWAALGLHSGPIGINVALADFLSGRLEAYIDAAIQRHGLNPAQLVIEVSEADCSAKSEAAVFETIRSLSRCGIRIALDDFGAAGGMLVSLLRLPLYAIKVDRSLIADLANDSPHAAITSGLLRAADRMNVLVVAEGVEHHGQVALLRDLGCSLGQGYLFSRPLDRTAMASLLMAARPHLPAMPLNTVDGVRKLGT